MSFVFTPQRVTQLNQRHRSGQVSAVLVLMSAPVREHSIRHYYREFIVHDPDGKATGKKREAIQRKKSSGEDISARLTVLLTELIDVEAENAEQLCSNYSLLDIKMAQACGFKTTQELRTDWKKLHPRNSFARLVWFALGDVRDKDRYLQRWIHRGGDYSTSRAAAIDELPSLTEEQLEELAANNHQRDTRRQEDRALIIAQETLAQRVARLENAGEYMCREYKNELDIMIDRARRGMRKIA